MITRNIDVRRIKMLNRISKKTAGIGIILALLIVSAYNLLIILKILPYTSFSGGALTNYQDAVTLAIKNIVVYSAWIALIAIATGLKKASFFKVWFWISFVSCCMDIISNLAGVTLFQKIVMTLISVIQAMFFLNLATDIIHKISKKMAGIGIISTYIFTIAIYLLAIFKILPFDEIGKGKLVNYQMVVVISIVSIFTTVIGMITIAIGSGVKDLTFFKVWFWLMFAFLCLNTLLNLASVTLFEKIIMGLATVVQAILYFRLARDSVSLK